ncbi:hypothetical protein HHI36_020127 [Cryptolaemus montrouzieri]|uniref:Uncharacterized protein n=1 Tax=Cryptolaemus montrouzieri TaxID=559131 RepID=A0ABD2NAD8_9CUCU
MINDQPITIEQFNKLMPKAFSISDDSKSIKEDQSDIVSEFSKCRATLEYLSEKLDDHKKSINNCENKIDALASKSSTTASGLDKLSERVDNLKLECSTSIPVSSQSGQAADNAAIRAVDRMQRARIVSLRGVLESADDTGSVLENDKLVIYGVLSVVRCNVAPKSFFRVSKKKEDK